MFRTFDKGNFSLAAVPIIAIGDDEAKSGCALADDKILETCEQFAATARLLLVIVSPELHHRRRLRQNPNEFPFPAMSKSFAAELQTIANSLVSGDAGNQQLSIAKIAERIAKDLSVKPDQ